MEVRVGEDTDRSRSGRGAGLLFELCHPWSGGGGGVERGRVNGASSLVGQYISELVL